MMQNNDLEREVFGLVRAYLGEHDSPERRADVLTVAGMLIGRIIGNTVQQAENIEDVLTGLEHGIFETAVQSYNETRRT